MTALRKSGQKLRLFTALTGVSALLLFAWIGWGFGDGHARTRYAVMEGIAAAKSVKLAIADYRRLHGTWPNPDLDAAPLLANLKPDRYVARIELAAYGHVLISYQAGPENPHPEIAGHTVALAPRVEGTEIRWDCRGGDMPSDYRPTLCRVANARQ